MSHDNSFLKQEQW